jgi:hypothetical protein
MKVIGIISTAVLSLLLGTAAPAYAQREQQAQQQEHAQQQQHAQQPKPSAQHAQHVQQAKPSPQHAQHVQQAKPSPQHAQHVQQAKPSAQHAQHVQQAKPSRPAQKRQQAQRQSAQQPAHHTREQQRVQQAAWQGHRSQDWQSDHRTWQQRGGYSGYRIPDNRYNGYFGSEHGFVIFSQPYMVVGGFPRFQYGGYWFSLVDPWPGYWANSWYETDDVYVVYANNGYYMYNHRYPGVGMAISVSL